MYVTKPNLVPEFFLIVSLIFQIIDHESNQEILKTGNAKAVFIGFGVLLTLFNNSANFFVYKFVLWKENRALLKTKPAEKSYCTFYYDI